MSLYSILIDPLLEDLRIYTIEFSGMKKGDRVLDVGCGTGDQVFYYGKRGIEATGIDLNPKMIKVAEERKRRENLSNSSFLIADAQKLPFGDNSFDFVSISLVLHEIEEGLRDKIISEMKRVLKKDGFLIFIDFKTPPPSNLSSFFVKTIEYLVGGNHYPYFKNYFEKEGLLPLLLKNKLRPEKIYFLKDGLLVIVKAKIINEDYHNFNFGNFSLTDTPCLL